MKSFLYLPLFVLLSFNALSQFQLKRANFWHFGQNAGLDFTCSPPVSFSGSSLNSGESCASISDTSGNLLMYSDGITVWDRNNNVMPNGTGLLGNQSTVQGAVFIPCFGDVNKYYIFTMGSSLTGSSEDNGLVGLNYSVIDMTLNGGFGDVVAATKNTFLFAPNEEKLTAVVNASNTGYWVVVQEKSANVWYAFEATTAGVNPTPVISTTGPPARPDNSLSAKFSPDGTLLATQNVCGSGVTSNANFTLYSFNDATGQINYLWDDCGTAAFKIEFSPDNSKIYVSGPSGLYQYDLNAGAGITDSVAIIASKTQISSSKLILQLANDCKIYTAEQNSNQIGVIDDPNMIGGACNYIPNYLTLASGLAITRFPNFAQSFFRGPCTVLDFDLLKTDAGCQSDGTITLVLNSGIPPVTYLWSNGATSQNLSNLSGGMYTVTVTDGRGCERIDSIFVNQPPSAAITNAIITDPSDCGFSDGSIDLTIDLVGGSPESLIAESFETDGSGSRYVVTGGQTGSFSFFKRDNDAGFNFILTDPSGEDGTFYFGSRNPSSNPCIVTINSTNIAGYTNLNACFALACTRVGNSTDHIVLEYRLNSGAWVELAAFYPDGGFPAVLAEDTDGDNVGDGVALSSSFQDFCFPIPLGNTIQLRVIISSVANQSCFAFDNIRLNGVPPDNYTVLWNTGSQAGATTEDISGLPAEIDSITITTGSGCVVGATFVLNDPCTLPIGPSFSASCVNENVILNWTTLSEQNSDKFLIEKRRDDGTWSEIGSVKASGNSNTAKSYSFTDYSSATNLSYYRLRLVDFNGGGQNYPPLSVSCKVGANNIQVFPNPNNGEFIVQISSQNKIKDAMIQIISVEGKIVTSKGIEIVSGVTKIQFNDSKFASGMYVLKVYGKNKAFNPVKIIKR